MINKKQTSVSWLRDKLFYNFGFAFSDNIIEHAKEIHKQEIIDAYGDGLINWDSSKDAEQYYKETYEQ